MYIFRELANHRLAYLLLLVLLTSAVAAFIYWGETKLHQQLIILALTVGYFLWGIITHVKAERITRYVVQEYAAIAVLGGLLLLLLTF